MTAAQLKALFQTNIGSKTAPGTIYPLNVTDCLDAIVDSIVAGDIGNSPDTIAPTIVTKSVANATPTIIDVVFSESVNASTAGWSAKKNGSSWPGP